MIKVIKPGVQLSVQDLGRTGYRHLGVSKTGSLDPYSQIIANRLINNNDNDAVLEITVGLCELTFLCSTVISLHGADLQASIDGEPIYPGWSYNVKANQTMCFNTGRAGLRAYLAVKGGIKTPLIMESRATDLNACFGGLNGNALSAGDILPIDEYINNDFKQTGALTPAKRQIIRVHSSPHSNTLGQEITDTFVNTRFKVSHNSNRMGVRLENAASSLTHTHSLPSIGVSPGSIQLPPNGEPIVLLNDAQTTGGYPLLGTVIEADLHQFAQFRPGDSVKFEYVTFEDAAKAQRKLNGHLEQLKIALKNKR